MELTPRVLDLNYADIEMRIERFIKNYVENAEATGVVLGMSGGVDSNTIAALCSRALGGDRVLGLMLPEEETYNPKDVEDAQIVAKEYSLKMQTCEISSAVKAFYKSIPIYDQKDRLCKGNIKARTRMIFIYYYSNKLNRIVCGSSDKSETMMGYFTKWGDVAADISPIMDLFKTQVRKLAEHLGIPAELTAKPSTPALWPQQSAEEEIGIKYEKLDLILFGLEHFMTTSQISEQIDVEQAEVEKVKTRWVKAEHKRRMPLTPKLQYRTIGTDFRLPYGAY